MHFAVGLLYAIDGHALAFVTARAAKFFGRMGVVGQKNLSARMGPERMLFFFKAGSVDGEMARLAAVHPRNRLIESIAIELIERHLLNLWNLVKRKWAEFERRILHHADPLVALRRELGDLVLDRLRARANLFDFLF